ncbi:MAG: hypothetical protein LBQ49_00620 [Rickettsiales bacterium]|jgi:hypothetical protein|nr:hypothetical protein [Rickettsiales bacterium]
MDGVKKLSLEMVSGESDMDILGFAASNEKMSVSAAGKIADESARDLDVAISMDGRSLRCVLSGDDKNFGCGRWSFADEKMSATGTLAVFGNEFQMVFKSKNAAADIAGLVEKYIGKKNGSVEFEIGDKAVVMAIGGGRVVTEYVEKNATLENFPKKLPIPKDMRSVSGNIAAKIDGGKISLVFQSAEWTLSIDDENRFMLSHKDAGKLLASLTGKPVLPFVKPRVPVRIVGKFSEGMITEMNAEIADMRLGGTVIGDSITLAAADLDLDKILDEKWFAEFRDNQYLSGDPILAPFGFGAKLALKAGAVVLNGARYRGVTYYLDEGGQYLSIADADAGKMLIGVSKEKSKYKFLVKLDKFFIPRMFGETAPVNIEGATVTAEAELESRGLTARDIRKNMTGVIDLSADGGFLIGLGVDAFYDNAARYDKRDVEGAVVKMLSDGRTAIKELSVSGEYNGGDFRTTKPFLLIARHADITGNVSIQNNKAAARANIMLRGTNALPKPIALNISNGRRDWAISEILSDIDLYYLREFASTRGKF